MKSWISIVRSLILIQQLVINFSVLGGIYTEDNEERLFQAPKKLLLCSMMGGKSHIKLHLEIGKILVERGHEVSYASASDQVGWGEGYNIKPVDLGVNPLDEGLNRQVTAALTSSTLSFSTLSIVIHAGVEISYRMVYEGLKREILANRPDLIICDYLLIACYDVASEMGVLYAGSFPTFGYVDQSMASYITNRFELLPPTTASLTFPQKLASTLLVPLTKQVLYLTMGYKLNAIRKAMKVSPVYGNPWQKLDESLIFVDTFFGFDSARPIPPLVQPIGPVVPDTFPSLDDKTAQFLSQRNQTCYVAFGTIVYLDTQQATSILEGLIMGIEDGVINGVIWSLVSTLYSQLPSKVLVRGSLQSLDSVLKEYPILLLDYAPQVAILKHPSTKTFLSHCGIESSFEGLLAGIPFLAVPFFGDQLTNAGNLVDNGVAIAIDRYQLTSTKVFSALKKLSDESATFSIHVNRMKHITYAASFNKFQAADLIERVMFLSRTAPKGITNPLGHLVTRDTKMSWFTALNYDVYVFLLAISLSLIMLYRTITSRLKSTLPKVSSKDQSHTTKEIKSD